MNGKQAKRLRQIIREDMGNYPVTQYTEVNVHDKQFFTGQTNLDGSPQYVPVRCSTRELVACQRKAYQLAKQLHHQYTF